MTNRDLKMLADLQTMRSLGDDGTMSMIIHDAVHKGSCVMIHDGRIIYAGPIKNAPTMPGSGVLLHADDCKALKKLTEAHTNVKH